jgi:hypothetical protein
MGARSGERTVSLSIAWLDVTGRKYRDRCYHPTPGSSMKQHCNPGTNELRQKRERVTRVTGHVARNIAVLGLELHANTHLQGRDISFEPRSVHINPMLPVIEVEEHG